MTKVIAQTYTLAMEYRAKIAGLLLVGCLALAAFYGLNVYLLISRTVATQHIQAQTASLSSSVDALETTYIGLSNAVTPEALKAHGMQEGQVSLYVKKAPALGRGVALSGHEL